MAVWNSLTITQALTSRWLARPVYFFPEIGSTNVWLKEHEQELEHGTVAITDHQTAGKGRLGRVWTAPPGTSLLLSALFRPGWPAPQSHWLTMIAGLAAVEAIRQETNCEVRLKWPNDVVVLDGRGVRKLGGILLEGEFEQDKLKLAIVGMGLNVNIAPADLPPAVTPATSLLLETGELVSRLPLLVTLLERLEWWYEQAHEGHSPHEAWASYLVNLGQGVQVTNSSTGQILEGVAEDTDEQGHLLVRDAAGVLHVVSAGDVTLQQRK